MENKNQQNQRWYIALSTFNWFDGIKVKSAEVKPDANWDGYMYFDSEDEAKKFLKELKSWINQEYPDLSKRKIINPQFKSITNKHN